MLYGNGLSIIPFASRKTHVTGTLIPTKIPNINKPSFLRIIHQKSAVSFV